MPDCQGLTAMENLLALSASSFSVHTLVSGVSYIHHTEPVRESFGPSFIPLPDPSAPM